MSSTAFVVICFIDNSHSDWNTQSIFYLHFSKTNGAQHLLKYLLAFSFASSFFSSINYFLEYNIIASLLPSSFPSSISSNISLPLSLKIMDPLFTNCYFMNKYICYIYIHIYNLMQPGNTIY